MDIDSDAVTELPTYRALLVVDMKNFSGERGRDHARLTEAIPGLLRQTFRRCGLAELWEEALFQGSTGDGYYLGFNSRLLPFLLNPFLAALQDELAYRNSVSQETIRMRVSINVGPMAVSGANTISDGSGNSRIETHRLLDSEPVRDLLDRSGAVTCVAAIVSARAYEDAVLAGYSDEDSGFYVPAPVQVKSYQGTAYLRVPRPSGELLSKGFRPDGDVDPAPRTASGRGPTQNNAVSGVHDDAAQVGSRVSTGVGDISGNGNQITSVQGNQHNEDQYSGPHYEGTQTHSTHHDGDGDGHVHVSGTNQGGIHQNLGSKGKR